MSGFDLSNDDVISMNAQLSFTDSKTSKTEDMMDAIRDLFNSSDLPIDEWLDGIECEVLQAKQGGGWQKGKIRLVTRLEFIPYEPKQTEKTTSAITHSIYPVSNSQPSEFS
ncbi:hypothetical protein IQ244_20230 [Nostoc sp. LEGE 06077]|uniref:KGK domain-containing protein n=1 Tax=Nostoc sp. LEGE 06077 TaxID=915325 RepID=UPI001881C3DA|nr:KGK domain-containing protein [Nostoc sp. LEGE 06077]MBE9208827.1 hypothetical protein [Nostoc sp. LEGE 06077]